MLWGAWPGAVGQAGHWGGGGMGGIGVCPALIKLSELHSLLLPAVPWDPLPPGEPGHHVPSVLLGSRYPAAPRALLLQCSLVWPGARCPLISLRDLFLGAAAGCTPQQRGGQSPLVPAASPCALLLAAPSCLLSLVQILPL